jgi:hypothetical protein
MMLTLVHSLLVVWLQSALWQLEPWLPVMWRQAARLLALHKVRRDYVQARVALDTDTAAAELGDVVRLTTARLGYGAGRDFVVVGIEADGKRRRLTLDMWG